LAVPVSAVQSDSKGEYLNVIQADGSTQRVDIVSGDLVDSLVTVTSTGTLAEGANVELGATSSSSSSSSRNQGGGGIMMPGVGGGPGGG
jgi:hypothetical protein